MGSTLAHHVKHTCRIGRITTTGAVTEFAIPTANSRPAYITTGPDGALWFTEQAANQIGRITTSGSIIEFQIPTPSSGPTAIAAGPDGAIWFIESTAHTIGQLSLTPTDASQCRADGYQHFIDPTTSQPFRNQGACISSVRRQ